MINKMIELDLSICNLTPLEMSIAKVAIKGEKEIGFLRASKPKEQKKTVIDESYKSATESEYIIKHPQPNLYATEEERIKALGCYVWRELAFIMSPIAAHHCMPVCNDFNLEYKYSDPRRKEQYNFCNGIVNKIFKTVKKESCYGLKRWARVFGL